MLRTIAVARLILGGRDEHPGAAEPDAGRLPMYLLAGINDWGGISPVTKRPHQPREAVAADPRRLRETTAPTPASSCASGSAIYPEYVRPAATASSRRRSASGSYEMADADGLVRREAQAVEESMKEARHGIAERKTANGERGTGLRVERLLGDIDSAVARDPRPGAGGRGHLRRRGGDALRRRGVRRARTRSCSRRTSCGGARSATS